MKKKILFLGILLTSLFVLEGGILNRSQTLEQEENLENTELAIYVEGEKQPDLPEKNNSENYVFDKAICYVNGHEDESITVSWDKDAWAPIIKGLSTYKTRCDLYFKEETELDRCYEQYGKDSINCKIIAQVDDTGACPTVTEEGNVLVTRTESTNGYVCSAPDDYGTSYYYRGNVENNWVKFAGYYWRILRINGDGSIRMIYAGDASVIDALPNKEEVLKNGYNDSSTLYTQIGEIEYNYYWKKDNVQETVISYVYKDNAGVGYMYGNRDGIAEGSTEYVTNNHATTDTKYYAKEYTYDVSTDRFRLKDPIGLLGTEITEDYVGWYTFNSTNSSTSNSYVRKVTSVEPSDGSSDAKVGYSFVRYGTTSKEKAQTNTNNSTIKEYIDAWYESHIKGTDYEQYIADTLFCNDRSLGSNSSSSYSQLGYGSEPTKYRWYSSSNGIKLTCEQQNDRFTVNDEVTGNGDLTYPIGLLTTDEAYLAGGSMNYNREYYLYSGDAYWTMSPYIFYGDAGVRSIDSNGAANSATNSYGELGVRPVINLKPDSLNNGNGTASSPYRALPNA